MASPAAADAPTPNNRNSSGFFQCGVCAKTYSRLDHLARHVRSHTQEKPYRCEVCEKQFGRLDLLRRHSLLHNATTDKSSAKRPRMHSTVNPPIRVSKACEACAENHLKCEAEKPCRRCVKRGIACVLAPKPLLDPKSNPSGSLPNLRPKPIDQDQSGCQATTVEESLNIVSESSDGLAHFDTTLPSITVIDAEISGHTNDIQPAQEDSEELTMQDKPNDALMPGDFFPNRMFPSSFRSGSDTPNYFVDFGGGTDLDFSAIDLSFLDTYNNQVPFEYEGPTNQTSMQISATETFGRDDSQQARIDDEGFAGSPGSLLPQSLWRFVPAPGVHGYSDQANLSLPSQDQIVHSPESVVEVHKRATTERLDSATRDKILAIVLSQVKSSMPFPVVNAFPSVELLDKLIQFFLVGPIPKSSSWIHTASFYPKKTRPELLLSMAAAGAVLTPDRSLRKLGFAIQEVIRNHLAFTFESDNTLVRNLDMSQAYILHLQIGLWSGNNRKIEISESFQQPLLTMLRRGGRFKRSSYHQFDVLEDDQGAVLEKKWHAWIEQESFKRLAYQLLSHDAEVSMSLLVNPLISYAELGLPLPESLDLWLAPSAAEWKSRYRAKFQHQMIQLPSLTECVANPELLKSSKGVIDLNLSFSALLYAMWGMVWGYRKLNILLNSESNLWECGIGTMTRYQEVTKIFDYLRISFPGKSTFLIELILMHLHMSLEDIQIFCDLDGPDETRRAHASIKRWASSKTSRQAVWHAGQVVRAARLLPPLHLRDFYAISLFHAGLTFLAYGLAGQLFEVEKPMEQRLNASHGGKQTIWLDEEETSATYRYISLNHGAPALHGTGSRTISTELSNPKGVIDIIIETLKRGDSEPSRPNSPLVENLVNMLERIVDVNWKR